MHCRARTADETDWKEIASLYAILEALRATPAVRVNRAFALSRVRGAAAGLALLGDGTIAVESYPYFHLVKGTLLGELGEVGEARRELLAAAESARNEPERAQIRRRIAELENMPVQSEI